MPSRPPTSLQFQCVANRNFVIIYKCYVRSLYVVHCKGALNSGEAQLGKSRVATGTPDRTPFAN